MFLLLSTTLCGANITTKDTLVISSTQTTHRAGNYLHTLEDKKGQKSFLDISNSPLFVRSTSEIPNFGITSSCYWVKLIVKNETNSTEDFMLEFEKITADNLTLYYKVNDSSSDYTIINANNRQKKYLSRQFLFDLNIPTNKSATIFIKYKTNWATTFPILISSREKMLQDIFNEELIKGIYIGILFIMVFYNLFIYFSIKDKSYLYYVIYISFFLALQLNDFGYTHKYLFYNYPLFYDLGIKILPSLTSISAILFVRNFLNTKLHCSKLDKGLNILVIAFTLILCFSFNNQDNELYFTLINILTQNIKRISFWLLIVCGFFGIVSMILINSSIRLSIYSKRFNIKTMQMVGATKRFIRKPFIWQSIKLGTIGAVLALIGLGVVVFYIDKFIPSLELLNDYLTLGYLIGGVLISAFLITWISTFFATQRFLNLQTNELYY